MILVVSHAGDDHAAGVLAELERARHPAVLLDTARFPREASLTQAFDGTRWRRRFVRDEATIDLDACGAAWWRRPQPYTLHDGMTAEVASFSYSECHEAVAGAWASLDCTWVNPPHRDEVAHHKPSQLTVAAAVGMTVPRTLITNDPAEARAFVADRGAARTVYKTFLASEGCWRETRLLRDAELALLDTVAMAPVIFQEYVAADADVRVTVIGPWMFAARIETPPSGYAVDYRMDMAGARFAPLDLPAPVVQAIRSFMARLGLVYGALDFRRTPAGEYVFLEVNPAGEWRFVEERTGQPITQAMAQLLMDLDGRGRRPRGRRRDPRRSGGARR